MGRYGPENPEGDDRPAGMHDPLTDEDRLVEQLRDRPVSPLMDGWSLNAGSQADLGPGSANLVTLVGQVIRGVFLLVTWPVRRALRQRRASRLR